MRLLHAVWADIRFQFKQGFYLVYVLITVMYLIILSFLPEDILSVGLPLVVFSDPSVLGLFFIGGIIMLEKMQGVLSVLVVSPLRTIEYILSKVISLAFVSVLAAFAITGFSNYGNVNWLLVFLSTVLTSAIFTLCGIMITAGCNTVNQYMIKTVPYMLLLILPCFSLIGFPYSDLFTIIPSVAALRLMLGAYSGIPLYEAVGLIIYLVGMNYLFLRWAIRVFENKIIYQD
ncbi:MAG: ABC transporter permease [Clostridia bacterium]|nr:ABC transporter permease [Clostridia bacterium]MDD3094478.1 ABC transporter permease [Clostridia bacterium]MDD3972955.1 ABC transporter permease [Clostridia bacterium]